MPRTQRRFLPPPRPSLTRAPDRIPLRRFVQVTPAAIPRTPHDDTRLKPPLLPNFHLSSRYRSVDEMPSQFAGIPLIGYLSPNYQTTIGSSFEDTDVPSVPAERDAVKTTTSARHR